MCHGQFFTSISEPFVPSPQSLLRLTEKLFILTSKVLDPIKANKRCLNVARVPWSIRRDSEAGTDFAAIDQLHVRDRDAASRADRRRSCPETAAAYDDIDRLSDQRALR